MKPNEPRKPVTLTACGDWADGQDSGVTSRQPETPSGEANTTLEKEAALAQALSPAGTLSAALRTIPRPRSHLPASVNGGNQRSNHINKLDVGTRPGWHPEQAPQGYEGSSCRTPWCPDSRGANGRLPRRSIPDERDNAAQEGTEAELRQPQGLETHSAPEDDRESDGRWWQQSPETRQSCTGFCPRPRWDAVPTGGPKPGLRS